MAEAKVAPGQTTGEYYHVLAESYYVLRGRVLVEGESHDMRAGDGIAILPGKRHRMANTGAGTRSASAVCLPTTSGTLC